MVQKTGNLSDFKKIVRKAVLLEDSEAIYFDSIPDDVWKKIFEKNFGNNTSYATRVILNKFKDIDRIDIINVDKPKLKIANLDKCIKTLNSTLDSGEKVVFVTDYDNDGSLSQAVIMEYMDVAPRVDQMIVEYAQNLPGNSNRGLTVDLVDLIVSNKKNGLNQDDSFLIVTADNGINSLDEQNKIQTKYPNVKIIITDHHNPEKGMTIDENDRCIIFNPKYKPDDFYKHNNISGAATIGVLLKQAFLANASPSEALSAAKNLNLMDKLSRIANLLDYVDTAPADKPEKDYVITKFLALQPLLNTNNSLGKIINGHITYEVLDDLKKANLSIDTEAVKHEIEKVRANNHYARILLTMYHNREKLGGLYYPPAQGEVDKDGLLLSLMTDKTMESNLYTSINTNYIEQLRPLIFNISADDDKDILLDYLNDKMIALYEGIRASEKSIMQEIRKSKVVEFDKSENSTIMSANEDILKLFNRKFLTKCFNIENPGFLLTIDNKAKEKVSGSFRSLYDISDIFPNKEEIETKYKVKIDTPGHEKAAGFIIKSLDGQDVSASGVMDEVNKVINQNIAKIKKSDNVTRKDFILTDLSAITIIDKINTVVRGNISNFERITPLIKMDESTVWTDAYSTKQYSMSEIIKEYEYGYINININFHGDTAIVPIDLIRSVVKNDFKDYVMLNYMEGGVFMADRIVSQKQVNSLIDLRDKNEKSNDIKAAFKKLNKVGNLVKFSNAEIKDNPFYKYHDFGDVNFDLFQSMVISLIEKNEVDCLTVFDVEANGFGNSKLMNIGSMNYFIDNSSGEEMLLDEYRDRLFTKSNNEQYLVEGSTSLYLKEISANEYELMNLAEKREVLAKYMVDSSDIEFKYFIANEDVKLVKVYNNKEIDNERVVFNRTLKAEMLSYLVKDKDFKVPQEMTNLTGITQEILDVYGENTAVIDRKMTKYYKGKKVLFGAHNTPYDARVVRANMPLFNSVLKSGKVYDSALFSSDLKLAYDGAHVTILDGVEAISKNIIFYNNNHSDWNLKDFLEKEVDGCYPDRSGNYLIEVSPIVREEWDNIYEDIKKDAINKNIVLDPEDYTYEKNKEVFYFVDKIKHEKILIKERRQHIIDSMFDTSLPNKSIKYSVEKLSEQWMVRALLLSDESFTIKYMEDTKVQGLPLSKDALILLQKHYQFGSSSIDNIDRLCSYLKTNLNEEDYTKILRFTRDFLIMNKDIQHKFSDSWMYKKVLNLKDPSRTSLRDRESVELISYQTNIPKEKVNAINVAAINFKKKHNIEHVLFHEGHVNGLWEGDHKGDIVFEDKLTLTMLAQKYYNTYSKNINDAVDVFNRYQVKAQIAYDVSDLLSDGVANDSYSYRQAVLYDRDDKSSNIDAIQDRERDLKLNGRMIVKFKLGNDVLAPDTAILAVKKENALIDRVQLEKDADMIKFIAVVSQLEISLKKQPSIEAKKALQILEVNQTKVEEYLLDLSERYCYMEHSKKDSEIKKVIDSLVGGLEGVPMKDIRVSEIDVESMEKINKLYDKYALKVEERLVGDDEMLSAFSEVKANVGVSFELIKEKCEDYATGLLQSSLMGTIPVNEVKPLSLTVNMARRDPVSMVLNKFPELGLVQEYIKQTNLVTSKPKVKSIKP